MQRELNHNIPSPQTHYSLSYSNNTLIPTFPNNVTMIKLTLMNDTLLEVREL